MNIKNLLAVCLMMGSATPAMGQKASPKAVAWEQQLKLYRDAVAEDKNAPLQEVLDPQAADLMAVAERAIAKLFAGKDAQPGSDLRTKAQMFQKKLAAIQTSDLGRWLAQDEETVLVFMGFGQDTILLSERELGARLTRLKASRQALENFTSKAAGSLDPKASPAAVAVLEDATWVESHFNKLDQRLDTLAEYESQFPEEEDWSKLPTLAETIRSRIAADVQDRMQQLAAAKKQAEDEALEADVADELENTKSELTIHRQGRQNIAAVSRKLLEAEYASKAAELETEVVKKNSAVAQKRLANQQLEAASEQERVEQYLRSPEIQQLMAPFCSPGEFDAATANMGGPAPVKSRDKGPMSLSRLQAMGALNPDRKGVTQLVDVATSPHNDRVHWAATRNNWSRDEFTITDMNGKEVNRFVEAQNILINHSAILVKLKMLTP